MLRRLWPTSRCHGRVFHLSSLCGQKTYLRIALLHCALTGVVLLLSLSSLLLLLLSRVLLVMSLLLLLLLLPPLLPILLLQVH
jgi:hypothetical protein